MEDFIDGPYSSVSRGTTLVFAFGILVGMFTAALVYPLL